MEIKSLGETDIEIICKAFIQAFADYDIQLNAAELKTMWKRRGFNPALQFAAFEGEDDIEDIEAFKATIKAAMIQAKKIAKKKYTPKKYRRD